MGSRGSIGPSFSASSLGDPLETLAASKSDSEAKPLVSGWGGGGTGEAILELLAMWFIFAEPKGELEAGGEATTLNLELDGDSEPVSDWVPSMPD